VTFTIQNDGTVECPDGTRITPPEVRINMRAEVIVDGKILEFSEALGVVLVQRNWWMQKCQAFESELGDAKARLQALEGE